MCRVRSTVDPKPVAHGATRKELRAPLLEAWNRTIDFTGTIDFTQLTLRARVTLGGGARSDAERVGEGAQRDAGAGGERRAGVRLRAFPDVFFVKPLGL